MDIKIEKMKKIITFTILIVVSSLFQIVVFFPWWGFLIPIFLLGIVLPIERWKIHSFLYGLLAGFIVWISSTFYFEIAYKGEITILISKMLSIPNFLLYIIIGLIGGVLTGLAFYSGFLLRKGRETLQL